MDAIKNIQHVGHSHLRIAKTAYKQLKKLNTNTRYSDKIVLDYTKSIIKKVPEKLSICFFSKSENESNDLALRISINFTKNNYTIVVNSAYHGHTISLIAIRLNKYKGIGEFTPPPCVH